MVCMMIGIVLMIIIMIAVVIAIKSFQPEEEIFIPVEVPEPVYEEVVEI